MVLADGTTTHIADVAVGDHVLAWDLHTGTAVSREVTATLPHTDWLLGAHFSDGSVLEVTEDHRFWSTADADWVELQDLDTSDVLLTPMVRRSGLISWIGMRVSPPMPMT